MRKAMKRLICSVLTIAFLLSLTACGSDADNETNIPSQNATEQTGTASAGGLPLRMVADGRMQKDYANEMGYYTTLPGYRTEAGENIIYTDFATGTRLYLCNLPDCQHKDDTCTSYFAGEMCGSSVLVPCGEKLYRFFEGVYTDNGRDSDRPQIWSMNLDGSDRKLVYTSPNEEQPLFTCTSTATDGVNFYFPVNRYEKATYDPEKEQSEINGTYLGCFNMETQKMTTLCPLPGGVHGGASWVGCAGREIIGLQYEKDPDTGKNMQYFEALNVDTLETRRLPVTWEEVSWKRELMGDETYSRLSQDGKDVETLDYATGQVKVTELERLIPDQHEVWLVRDGHALISWEEAGTEQFYALDLESGEIHQALSIQDEGPKGGNHPSLILAEYEGRYLIEAKQEAVPITYYHLDGTTEKKTVYLERQAMIPKEDYWTGNTENMTWIQDKIP